MRKLRSLSALLFVTLLGCFLPTSFATAQTTAPNQWTWMGGDNWSGVAQYNQGGNGNFGTFGVFGAGNIPRPVDTPSTWTGSDGHLWLFGGDFNDLWQFDPSTNEWAWMAGPPLNANCVYVCTTLGLYGTNGTPAAGNNPGQRWASTSWTDKDGKFWLFGGFGYGWELPDEGYLNDLWMYDPTIQQWEWVSGAPWPNTSGVYGTLGTPGPANTPGARSDAQGWTDKNGNLWLQGGQGIDASGTGGYLTDLWEYTPATNLWRWVSGSNTATVYSASVYGTQGVPAAGNTPGARLDSATWTDSTGNFWLFSGNVSPNDLWEFSPDTGLWTWIAGSTTTCAYGEGQPCPDSGVYGTLGVASPGNIPGTRFSALTWTDKSGNFWLFGGQGLDTGTLPGLLNDLWEFNPSTKQWAWMGGSNSFVCPEQSLGEPCADPGIYGTLGTPSTANVPVGRAGGAGWVDSSGNFWIFSGVSTQSMQDNRLAGVQMNWVQEHLNDLWEFQPSANTLPPAVMPVFSLVGGTYTPPQTVTITNGMANASIYYTTDGSTPTQSSTLYTGPINLSTSSPSETLEAIAVVPGYSTSGAASVSYSLTPEKVIFSSGGGTFNTIQQLTISDGSAGATIFYSCYSCTSNNQYTLYTGPITIDTTEYIDAYAMWPGGIKGPGNGVQFEIYLPPAAAPTFAPPAGTYNAAQSVVLSDSTPGASIYYTTDGSYPDTSSTLYAGPIAVNQSETIQAFAVANSNGYGNSMVNSAAYVVTLPNFSMKATTPVGVIAGATTANTSAITITPAYGFTGNVALTAALTSSPANAVKPPTLSFGATTPVSITGTAAGAATLTIATTATINPICNAMNQKPLVLPWGAGGGVVLACVLLFGIPARRRGWRNLLGMVALLCAFANAAIGCGGGGASGGGGQSCSSATIPGTTSGQYTITVTATSGSITQTSTVSLTVQ